MVTPAGDTGRITAAATARPDPSRFTNDVRVPGCVPAGRPLRWPGWSSPTLVTLTAIAVASGATPGGSGTGSSPPPPSGPPVSRVSATRRGSTGTNRPALAAPDGTNTPVTSTITSPGKRLNTSSEPSAPSGTIAELATARPGAVFTVEVCGRGAPPGYAVTNAGAAVGRAVTVTAAATASSGTASWPTTSTRITSPLGREQPHAGARVSAKRTGPTGRYAEVVGGAACAAGAPT